jgi:hypothetical protein
MAHKLSRFFFKGPMLPGSFLLKKKPLLQPRVGFYTRDLAFRAFCARDCRWHASDVRMAARATYDRGASGDPGGWLARV